jgi:hypothetical protein
METRAQQLMNDPCHGFVYRLIRFNPDPSVGEFLNVGVVLVSRDGSFADGRISHDTRPLKAVFRGFNETDYIHMAHDFKIAFVAISQWEDIEDYCRQLVPDQGVSVSFSGAGAGIIRRGSFEQKLDDLFERMIVRRRPLDP